MIPSVAPLADGVVRVQSAIETRRDYPGDVADRIFSAVVVWTMPFTVPPG